MARNTIVGRDVVVYAIRCKDPKITSNYVGMTCDFYARLKNHKCACTKEGHKYYAKHMYQFMREHGGWEGWEAEVLEEFHCENRKQAGDVERKWLDALGGTLNHNVPGRTSKEYRAETYAEDPDYYREKSKAAYHANKKPVLCECGTVVIDKGFKAHLRTRKHARLMEERYGAPPAPPAE